MNPQNNAKPAVGALSEVMHSSIVETLAKVGVCVKNVGLYGRFHPVVRDTAIEAEQSLGYMLASYPAMAFAVAGSYFVADSFPVEDGTGCLASFSETLNGRKIGEIKFSAGISAEEIIEFAEVMTLSPEDLTLRGGLNVELQKRNVRNIQLKIGFVPVESRQGQDAADIYEEALFLVEEAMKAVQSGLHMPAAEIRSIVADSLHCLIADDSALLALAGIRSYDRYLSEHSVNVCILSMVLGRDLGLDTSASLELGVSAMLHDVGKVFVSGDVVRKPGKLSEEEWQQIRRHPADGARALAGLPDLPSLASTIALEHHVHCDGSGYPAISEHQTPHLLSRLVAIVDTYDALTTDRPYREQWTAEQAIAYMLYEAWRQYDRQLLARFASRARLYPLGSLVRLKRGDLAVIIGGSHKHPRRPTLRVVVGEGARTDKALVVDLSTNTDPGLEIDTIAQPVEVLLPFTDKLIAA